MNFIDANVFLRAIVNDHPRFGQNARKLFQEIKAGNVSVVTTDLAVAEIVYVLSFYYKFSQERIRQSVKPLILLDNVSSPSKSLWEEIFDVYVVKNVDFMDAYNMIVMRQQQIQTAYSYDHDFDKVGLLKRIEP